MPFIQDKVPYYHHFFGVFQNQILRINCPPQPLNLSPQPPQAQLPRWSWEGRKSHVASLYACSLALCCDWGRGQWRQQRQPQQPLRQHDLRGRLEAASAMSYCEGCAGPRGRRISNRWGESAWREVLILIQTPFFGAWLKILKNMRRREGERHFVKSGPVGVQHGSKFTAKFNIFCLSKSLL